MRLEVIDPERCVGCQQCMFACTRRQGRGGLGKAAIEVRSVGGMERGFIVVVCRACSEPSCAQVCPQQALTHRAGGGVRLDADLCNGCGTCRSGCIIGAVFWDDEEDIPVICLHCGYCVQFCPHGVLARGREEGAKDERGGPIIQGTIR